MNQQGMTLVECLVYIAITSVIMGLAFESFYHCQANSKNLNRNVNDTIRVLQAGENWRKDIRTATEPPKIVKNTTGYELHIPQGNKEVIYFFSNRNIWRKTTREETPSIFLQGVKASDMIPDKQDKVTSWRWEIELISMQKTARVRPLFTFQAVPAIQS